MLLLENQRLANYMLSGNRSMFLETNCSLACMCYCPLVHLTIHTVNYCYSRIAIHYEGQTHFVDPIAWQTHPAAKTQNCFDRIKNLFQFDMDQEDSWYTLTPAIEHQDRSAVFGSKDVSPVAIHSSSGSQDAGMYTTGELSSLWNNMLISVASGEALKKCSQEVIVFSNNKQDPGGLFYNAP